MPPRPPPTACSHPLSPLGQVREFRIAELTDQLADIATDAAARLKRIKTCADELKVYTMKPMTAGAFTALRERFARLAAAAQLGDNAVTPVLSLRRGVRPVDIFSVMHDALVDNLVGASVLQAVPMNGAVVKLVAPFDFLLRARRGDDGELTPVKELVVKAHVVALVPDHANPQAPLFRVDLAAYAYSQEDQQAYACSLANAIQQQPANMPPAFLAWAAANGSA